MPGTKLGLREVILRRDCVLYELFEFAYQQSDGHRNNNLSKNIFTDFLGSHVAPKTTRFQGCHHDDGHHDARSLERSVRAFVKKYPANPKVDPIAAFLKKGYHSVKRPQYEQIVQSYQRKNPDASVVPRASRWTMEAESGSPTIELQRPAAVSQDQSDQPAELPATSTTAESISDSDADDAQEGSSLVTGSKRTMMQKELDELQE